jgi:hypothetical protein
MRICRANSYIPESSHIFANADLTKTCWLDSEPHYHGAEYPAIKKTLDQLSVSFGN